MLYIKLFWYNLRKYFFFYPGEFVGRIMIQIAVIMQILIFWSAVNQTFDPKLLSYLVIANTLGIFIFSRLGLADYIESYINDGTISNLLVKPINPIFYYLAEYFGKRATTFIIQSAIFTLFFIIAKLDFINFIEFLLIVIIPFFIALGLNLMISSLNFLTPVAGNIRRAISHILNLLSGLFVPIAFFPETIQKVLNLSPFPHIISLPTLVLQNGLNSQNLHSLLIAIPWAIAMMLVGNLVWKKSLKNYEAVGI